MKAQILGISLMIALFGISTTTFAQTQFDRTHPRRAEVNSRIARQDARIHHEVREGEISRTKAARLHREDHSVRREERRMAARDHGHLTRRDQARLNHRENRISRRIGR
ncbi:hypothetical protein BEL04_02995 [Mucilaginibacter sp. PPCGB 2223]|uniref:hypothetical protein n=1 Tax=Mucilaginibacter sp. PPCGB 2223 TaxID=1886027 RepID=UPI0008255631|nr:hypothetical protein [Mucilaginibacter sp. PPCGB 2223]OCX53288.1 hypothetical protein BEL04_02995 [Mucilaginibacter sp. PPCGB 2223]